MCVSFISAPDADILVKGKQSIKSQVLGNQNSESEVLLEGDDDIVSFMEEREVENLTGNFNYLIFSSASLLFKFCSPLHFSDSWFGIHPDKLFLTVTGSLSHFLCTSGAEGVFKESCAFAFSGFHIFLLPQ